MKISIVIPAHNEQGRIERTLKKYHEFFLQKKENNNDTCVEFVVVLNGCTDNTLHVVERVKEELRANIVIIDMLQQAGKGLAIRAGFANALLRDNDIIGFVDADMATLPDAFYDLIMHVSHDCDGVIASRYMPGADVLPKRPAYKRWGSRLIYEPFVRMLFGLSYYDLQCGAKVFKRNVIETVTPHLTVRQWAFDVELLYLCKKYGFTIKEVPTVWRDQADSKLTLRGGLRMFGALFKVWWAHYNMQKNK
jgi:glycosyltransferase involved in cell wall biosynthesis